jgi:5-methylcytosine-specific restriction protein A
METIARIRLRDCYQCRSCAIAVRTGEVDHIKSLEQGGSNDDDNLQLLCHQCHYEKTCRDNGFKKKTGATVDGLPISVDHHWNK